MKTTKTSPHILSTSANLLGFCLFVITALHVTDRSKGTLVDEFSACIALFLAISSLISFYSLRVQHRKHLSNVLENIADVLFIISLISIVILISFILFNFL